MKDYLRMKSVGSVSDIFISNKLYGLVLRDLYYQSYILGVPCKVAWPAPLGPVLFKFTQVTLLVKPHHRSHQKII